MLTVYLGSKLLKQAVPGTSLLGLQAANLRRLALFKYQKAPPFQALDDAADRPVQATLHPDASVVLPHVFADMDAQRRQQQQPGGSWSVQQSVAWDVAKEMVHLVRLALGDKAYLAAYLRRHVERRGGSHSTIDWEELD